MSAGARSNADELFKEDAVQEWGDFTGRSGTEAEGNWYDAVFEDVKEVLKEGPEYLRFENMELPKDQILEKAEEELEPGEDEYLKASLESYETEEGEFKIMNLEKGEIEGYRVATEGRSHRPVVTTDEFPGEGERLASIREGPSDNYQIMWEE